jgi:intracellular septation protein
MVSTYKAVIIAWSIEFGPIVLFFIALSLLGSDDKGFLFATGLFTFFTAAALLFSYLLEKRIAWFPLIAGLSVIIFGVMTLILKDPTLFMIKDTFYNGFFALFLLTGACMGKAVLRPLFITLFDMKQRGWYILSVRWGFFFLLLAVTNEIVWRLYSNDIWVLYKFWSTVVTAFFGLYQLTLSRKYRNDGSSYFGMRMKLYHETEQK